jgi:hypothetical protein
MFYNQSLYVDLWSPLSGNSVPSKLNFEPNKTREISLLVD